MISYTQIAHENASQARKIASRRASGRPYMFSQTELDAIAAGSVNSFARIPFIGDHTPKQWEECGRPHFVDASGCGLDSEPAMTIARFAELVCGPERRGHAYAIIERGQFQIYIQEYRKP